MCVDYRKLNAITEKDKYPLPRIDDQLERLSGNNCFTTLDLTSGYHQLRVATDSRPYTAFVTPDGHYQYRRIPFGLSNAPAFFQKAMNTILGLKRFTFAQVYLDDVLGYVLMTSVQRAFWERAFTTTPIFIVFYSRRTHANARFYETRVQRCANRRHLSTRANARFEIVGLP